MAVVSQTDIADASMHMSRQTDAPFDCQSDSFPLASIDGNETKSTAQAENTLPDSTDDSSIGSNISEVAVEIIMQSYAVQSTGGCRGGNERGRRDDDNKKKNNNKPYDEFLTTEEVIKVLSKPYPKSRANLGIRNRAIVILMITTGIRKSELTALKLINVDFLNKRLYIMNGKGDKFRVVALPELAIEALKEYLDSGVRPADVADDDFLFGSMYTMDRGGTDKPQTWRGLAESQPYKIVIKSCL